MTIDIALVEKTIQKVIDIRKSKIDQLKKIDSSLEGFNTVVDNINNLDINSNITSKELTEVKSLLNEFKSKNLTVKITDLKARIIEFKNFYCKDTINIGVAGGARVGKSTFMQSISGLSNTVIPSSNKGFCTGAKSIIYHNEGEPFAEVEFFSREEFLRERIRKVFKEIKIEDNIPNSLEEFQENPFPEVLEKLNSTQAELYNKLRKFHEKFIEYKNYIGSPKTKIPIDKVIDFVAQNKEVDGKLIELSAFVAVKLVKIYTSFPTAKIKKLALLDIPGIDEVSPITEKLVNTLKNELDIVLVVKKPSSTGDDWRINDFELFELISDNMEQEKIFVVFNKVESPTENNIEQIDLMKSKALEQLKDKNKKRSLIFNEILTANCKKRDEIDGNVLMPVLSFLEKNILRLDERAMSELFSEFDGIKEEFKSLIDVLKKKLKFVDNEEELVEFNKLFKNFMKSLRTGLHRFFGKQSQILVKDSGDMRERVESIFKLVCDKARNEVKLPSAEEAQEAVYDNGSPEKAFAEYLIRLRLELTKVMKTLNHHLNKLIIESISELLDEIKNISEFNKIIVYFKIDESKTSLDQFKEFMDKLVERFGSRDKCGTIITAFEKLFGFHFSYDTHFHFMVRQNMHLFNTLPKIEEFSQNSVGEAGEIVATLEDRLKDTIYGVEKALCKYSDHPNLAIYTVVEDFVDIFTRSTEIEDELYSLMRTLRFVFWPEKYNLLKEITELRQNLENNIINLIEKNV